MAASCAGDFRGCVGRSTARAGGARFAASGVARTSRGWSMPLTLHSRAPMAATTPRRRCQERQAAAGPARAMVAALAGATTLMTPLQAHEHRARRPRVEDLRIRGGALPHPVGGDVFLIEQVLHLHVDVESLPRPAGEEPHDGVVIHLEAVGEIGVAIPHGIEGGAAVEAVAV